MATIAVTATAQPANVPPRVKVDVVDSGTPAITSVNVIRTDAAGNVTPVRTLDGNPLTLVTSGSTRIGTLYDYEPTYGVAYTYSTVEYPTGVSASTTLAVTQVWLVNPTTPALSVPVTFYDGTLVTETYKVTQGIFYPMGRATPVVITDGARHAPETSLTLLTETLTDLTAVRALVAGAGTLLLNIPPSLGLGFDACYIAVSDVVVTRLTDVNANAMRSITLPFVVTGRPAGGSQALWTWANVIATYPTWTALMAANSTWTQVTFPS